MTKMKSKKMTKSTFAIVIMAIVMVAMLAFGGTYAYFTAQARVEDVRNIKTANLVLRNPGTALSYNANDEIVPGDYIFGAGWLNGIVDWKGEHAGRYTTIGLKLSDGADDKTTAAVFAFVRVTTRAYLGSDPTTAKTLMVKYGDGATDYAPVLRLIPWLGQVDYTDNEDPDETKHGSKAVGWTQFGSADAAQVGLSNSTYVFYFRVDDSDKCREAFETEGFRFSLQFDHRVHADKTELWEDADEDNVVDSGEVTYPYTSNVCEETAPGVYGEVNQMIMDVNIQFKMEFAIIQQTGFNTPADAFEAAFKDVGSRDEDDYTDDDLKPGWNGGTTDEDDDDLEVTP